MIAMLIRRTYGTKGEIDKILPKILANNKYEVQIAISKIISYRIADKRIVLGLVEIEA